MAARSRSFVVAWALSLFAGVVGADRFYLGRRLSAVVKLCTLGGLGVWAFIDTIDILAGVLRGPSGEVLGGYRQNASAAVVLTIMVWLVGLLALGILGWML